MKLLVNIEILWIHRQGKEQYLKGVIQLERLKLKAQLEQEPQFRIEQVHQIKLGNLTPLSGFLKAIGC